MNFLAHIYLSGNNPCVIIGNLMADSIKGLHYKAFDKNIQKGILLHRQIHTRTDAHPNFKSSTKHLHANYGHYSGIIVDIFYDHFLAKSWNDYSSQILSEFADKNYRLFQKKIKRLTPQIQYMPPYMIKTIGCIITNL